jgi:hypothetical protein
MIISQLVGFAEVWVQSGIPRSGTTLFASFSGKRRIPLGQSHFCSNISEFSFSNIGFVIVTDDRGNRSLDLQPHVRT